MSAAEFWELNQKYDLKIFEVLLENFNSLDDLDVRSKSDGTFKWTYTAICNFNYLWQTYDLPQHNKTLYGIRDNYCHMLDGFQALCS